jgi:hypothetical protein
MGIIAWIVLGLAAGLIANMLIPGKRSQGFIVTCLIGVAGALGGAGSPPSCSTSTPCRGSSTCPPGSPPSSALRSCCSPTTCSRRGPRGPDGPAAAAVTLTAEPGCFGFTGQLRPRPRRRADGTPPRGAAMSRSRTVEERAVYGSARAWLVRKPAALPLTPGYDFEKNIASF